MSCEEIRYWLKWLREQGWKDGPLGLALGVDRNNIRLKISGRSFIYVTEQRRLSKLIPRILSGELMMVKGQQGRRGYAPIVVAIADDPKPMKAPPQMAYDFKSGRLCWRVPRFGHTATIPGWNRGIANTREQWLGLVD